jgi:hypothetical protein
LPSPFAGALVASIQVGASDRIYALLNGERAGIAVIEPDGRAARVIDFADVDVGVDSFVSPAAFTVDPNETRIAILDQRATHQVKIISISGTLLHRFGPHTEGPGSFAMATSATWGPNETLWVVDTIRHAINAFDDQGSYLGRIGGFGHGPGQLNYPAACAFLSDHRIAVLERAGNRLQIFDLELQFLEYSCAGLEISGSALWSHSVSL